MSDGERDMLEALASADSRTAGDWLRVIIRREHAARFPEKSARPKKPQR